MISASASASGKTSAIASKLDTLPTTSTPGSARRFCRPARANDDAPTMKTRITPRRHSCVALWWPQLDGDASDAGVISAKKFETQKTWALPAKCSGQILEQAEWLSFGAQQDVARQDRTACGRAAQLDFEHHKAEHFCSAIAGRGDFHGIERHAEPAVIPLTIGMRAGNEIANSVAGDRKGQATGDHCVNSDHAAGGVGERTARISGSETHARLHPGLRPETRKRSNGVNHSGSECSHKAQRVADGDRKLAGPHARRISSGCGRQILRIDAERRDIANGVGGHHGRVELASVPELHTELCATRDVCVGDDDAVARPDYSRAVATRPCVDQNGGAAETFRDFAEAADGHSIRALRASVPRPPRSPPEVRRHGRSRVTTVYRSSRLGAANGYLRGVRSAGRKERR